MSNFVIFRQSIEKAIRDCVSAFPQRKENDNNEKPLSTVIESLVNQHILPLAGLDNILQVPLVDDKPDWRKGATELAFRRILIHLIQRDESEERFKDIFNCCDIVLHCSEIDLIDQVIPLSLVEELLDLHTTVGCERIFEYVEKRKNRLTVNMVPGKGKALILLRMCNELLRRLSKEINTVFCGRILMFLANSFPLDERSGVNLRGDFNTNTIHFDSNEEVDSDDTLTDEQKEFYKLFWSTRVYFANPPSVFSDGSFENLQKVTSRIVQKFQSIAEKDNEMEGSQNKESVGLKRTMSDYMEAEGVTENMLKQINEEFQFPRLLSSRRLLDLEMEDFRFRRSVIVQYLVLFQYLSGFSQEEKDKTAALLAAKGTTKQSLVQPNYVLSDEQVRWIDETREVLLSVLESTKPHGALYTEIISTILSNELHWINWKAAGCPSFKKPPINMAELQKIWKTKKSRLEVPPSKYRYTHGTAAISSLYGKKIGSLSEFMINRAKLPSVPDVINNAIAELQDSLDPPKERFNYANGVLLQASRLLYDSHPHLICKVYRAKKDIYKEMYEKNMDASTEDSSTADDTKPAALSAPASFTIGENLTEDHVQAEIEVLVKIKQILSEETEPKDEQGEKKQIQNM
ncbi:THO complex subunit 1 transcription elongation factor-domain-containing protein [Sporodiniella umbellata]|nr:THO complex subunit 1 transcription elongation factor-domain-containing protein [Sporodiniella umbellata]